RPGRPHRPPRSGLITSPACCQPASRPVRPAWPSTVPGTAHLGPPAWTGGAVRAAERGGASQAVIVVHHSVREIVDDAVAERRRAGFDRVRTRVVTAA